MPSALVPWASLAAAIVFETLGTTLLAQTEQLTRLKPTLLMAASYVCSFYCLSIALRTVPVGIAYAIWCGAGIVLVSVAGALLFKQHLDAPAYIGMGLIVAGVVVINVFSKSVTH